jgi:hypothetical protein
VVERTTIFVVVDYLQTGDSELANTGDSCPLDQRLRLSPLTTNLGFLAHVPHAQYGGPMSFFGNTGTLSGDSGVGIAGRLRLESPAPGTGDSVLSESAHRTLWSKFASNDYI